MCISVVFRDRSFLRARWGNDVMSNLITLLSVRFKVGVTLVIHLYFGTKKLVGNAFGSRQ